MRKSIVIGERTIELASNAYTPIAYKAEFGKDYFQDLFNMINTQNVMAALDGLGEGESLDVSKMDMSMLAGFDMLFFYRLFWVFAKSASPQIKPFDDFFRELEEFPLKEIAPVLMEMLNAGMSTKKSQTNLKQLATSASQ